MVLLYTICGVILVLVFVKYLHGKNNKLKQTRHSGDKLILHGMYGGKITPSVSPFVLKLETYLRLAKIPYELDTKNIWGPKGKTPWITYKGVSMGDSQLIINFLSKKFEINLKSKYSKEKQGIGTAIRILLEDHLYWCTIMYHFAYGGKHTWKKVRNKSITLKEWLIFHLIAPSLRSQAKAQGIGRHTESEVNNFIVDDLKTVSSILGTNKFILGDSPCEDDCTVFAFLAAIVFSPEFKDILLDEDDKKNLLEYCNRMKKSYWPDWQLKLSA